MVMQMQPAQQAAVADPGDPGADAPAEFYGVEQRQVRRIGVVCGRYRCDLAVPAHEPLAALAGELAELFLTRAASAALDRGVSALEVLCGPGPHGRWQLSTRCGRTLAPEQSVEESGIADGDTLVLDAPQLGEPAPLWDDPLAALAADTAPRRWSTGDSQAMAGAMLAAVAVVLGVSCAVLVLRGAGAVVTGIGAGAAVLAAVYTVIARSRGAGPATAVGGTVAAAMFVALAAAGAIPGQPGPAHLFAALAAAATTGAASGLLWPAAAAGPDECSAGWTLGAVAGIAATGCALVVWTPLSVSQAGVGLLSGGLLAVLAAPSLGVSLAHLRLPSTSTEHAGDEPLDVAEVRAQAGRARMVLAHASAAGGTLVVAGVALVLLAADRTPWSWLLGAAVAVVLVQRTRTVVERAAAACLMTTGLLTALVLVVAALLRTTSPLALAGIAVAVLAVAAGIACAGWWVPDKDFSPAVRRVADVCEVAVLCAVPPLALLASGVVGAVRG